MYLDDILIFSKDDDTHTDHIGRVFKNLREHKLQASASKCKFFKEEVVFLGFVVSTTGLRMDPAKLATIEDWPYPRNIAELRCFLGFTNFYRCFIPRISAEVSRLTDLTKKHCDVESGLADKVTQAAIASLVEAFTSAPFLKHFDFEAKHILQVDASAYAFSAILSQPDVTGTFVLVCYYSKKLNSSEARWQTHNQELGAIVAAFKEWRSWLMGANKQVVGFSNHANLRYFMEVRSLTPRQARWAAFLSSFNFVIMHTPGRTNPADPASRRPDFVEGSLPEPLVLFKSLAGYPVDAIQISNNGVLFDLAFAPPTEELTNTIKAGYNTNDVLGQLTGNEDRSQGLTYADRIHHD